MPQADADTQERIKNLAMVGHAIYEAHNDNTQQTNFYLAREALLKFKQGIDDLENLEEESRRGINELVKYLQGKIEKRSKADADVYEKGLDGYD